jgi:hypothetical protein
MGSLKKTEGEPSQIFDFNLGALYEILGSVFYQNNPTKRGDHKKR